MTYSWVYLSWSLEQNQNQTITWSLNNNITWSLNQTIEQKQNDYLDGRFIYDVGLFWITTSLIITSFLIINKIIKWLQ